MGIPLVSVCVTAYNHEKYLSQTLESIVGQQTSFEVEVVVGEDCSTDRTGVLCRQWVERFPDRIRLVTGPRNVGWRANYRRTIAACRGRYVALCDGDDYWSEPLKLQMQVERMESDPSCGMCFTRSVKIYEATERQVLYPAGNAATTFDGLLTDYGIENCTTLARRELLERYYAEVRPDLHPEWLTDDTPMWLWFAAVSGIQFIDRVTAVRRVLEYSVSHHPAYRKQIAFCDSISDINLWFDDHYGARRHRAELIRRKHEVALWTLSHHGPVSEYLRRWRCDVAAHPHLLLDINAYGLFAKKLLFRRAKKDKP